MGEAGGLEAGAILSTTTQRGTRVADVPETPVVDYRSIISGEDLASRLGNEDLVVLDTRFDLKDPERGRELSRESRIPGSYYADLDRDLAAPVTAGTGRHPLPAVPEFAAWIAALGIDPSTQVVAYDDAGGGIAARAWWLLRWLGHERVAVLDGGFSGWQEAGLPLELGNSRAVPVEPAPKPNSSPRMDWVLTTREVEQRVSDSATLRLLDARAAERFRGEVEPIDPVAGRIPGASNLPFTELLGPAGRLLPPGEVRARLEERLDGDLGSPWSAMCGSGVTACHLALAAEYAALEPPRIYIGSFSEWIRDPSRPVATGPA